MIIIVTGVPGTGKTTLSKAIAECLKHEYVDVNAVIEEHKLSEGRDEKRDCAIVDIKRLEKALSKKISTSNDLVIDSHLSHYLPSELVDVCIVVRCDLKILKTRLEKRGYSEEKVRENLDCEILDMCLNEAEEIGHNILVVDCSGKVDIKDICQKIKAVH